MKIKETIGIDVSKTTLNSPERPLNLQQLVYQAIHRTLPLLYDIKWIHLKPNKIKNTVNQLVDSVLIPLEKWFVGMTGFEPATTRPPAVYATGLRYIPINNSTPIVIRAKFQIPKDQIPIFVTF